MSTSNPDVNLGNMLFRASNIWQEKAQRICARHKLSYAHFIIMAYVSWCQSEKIASTQALIIKSTRLDKMTIGNALKLLIKNGLMTVARSREDTRTKLLSLTPKGNEMTHKLSDAIEKLNQSFLKSLKKESQVVFVSGLDKLIDLK